MYSTTKLVAAALFVTLFGGSLLTGILTAPPDREVLPAAVTESPSPLASGDLAFPTGTFVEAADSGYSACLIFRDDDVMDETSGLPSGTRRLLLSHPNLDPWVTVEVRGLDDGRYEASAAVDDEPLGEGVAATLQEAVRGALQALGEPYATDIAESVRS